MKNHNSYALAITLASIVIASGCASAEPWRADPAQAQAPARPAASQPAQRHRIEGSVAAVVAAARAAALLQEQPAAAQSAHLASTGGAEPMAGTFSDCAAILPKGFRYTRTNAPGVMHPANLRALCFSDFAVIYSGQSKTPVVVIEKLDANTLRLAKKQERAPSFYEEARLPSAERSTLADYASNGMGLDRGHLAPSGDFSTPNGRTQSNSLANVVPQNATMNRGTWLHIETATRHYVERQSPANSVWVITGAVFSQNPETLGRSKVWIPSSLYKFVLDPSAQKSWAQLIANSATAKAGKPITYEELAKKTGVSFFDAGRR